MIYLEHPKSKKFCWFCVKQDLFEQWGVELISGNITNKTTKVKWFPALDEYEARAIASDIEYEKRKLGYLYQHGRENFYLERLLRFQ